MHYHISDIDLGEHVRLIAKVPGSAIKGKEDTQTPRVCFAPSIEQCLITKEGHTEPMTKLTLAMCWSYHVEKHRTNPAVYVTRRRLCVPKASQLPKGELARTEERWSKSDIDVSREGFMCMDSLLRYGIITLTSVREHTITEAESKHVRLLDRMSREFVC